MDDYNKKIIIIKFIIGTVVALNLFIIGLFCYILYYFRPQPRPEITVNPKPVQNSLYVKTESKLKSKSDPEPVDIIDEDDIEYTKIYDYPPKQEIIPEIIDKTPIPPSESEEEYFDASNVDTTGLLFEEGVSEEVYNAVLKKYALIPSFIKEQIVYTGHTVIVAPDGRYTNGHAGQYDPDNLLIAINGSSVKKADISVIHEIGHFYDANLAVSQGITEWYETYGPYHSGLDPEWQDIYYSEKGSSDYPSYITDLTLDFYAECFRDYFERPDYLKSHCPRAYEYIRKDLEYETSDQDQQKRMEIFM